MAESAQEKTEAPSQKKRDDSRQEGQVAVSRELPSALMLGAVSLYFWALGETTVNQLKAVWAYSFNNLVTKDFTTPLLWKVFIDTVFMVTPIVIGLFALVVLVALFSNYIQVGFVLVPFKLKPERLNPMEGFKRIFSVNGLAELMKSLFKMGVIGYITFVTYQQEIMPLLTLSRLTPEGIFAFNFQIIGTLFGRVALALAILAVFDFLYQRWHLDQQLMMTKQEVKEEMRQTEGDPLLKSRVRQMMRDASRARMMENVPKADVVVTNPTHYAVALQYDREVMDSPRLVAKGADYMARRIREVAEENGVTIVENPLVAREVYNTLEIGDDIPEHLFRAVAEILAYVFKLKGRTL